MADSVMSSPNRPTITRHRTRKALVGGIPIGGGSPITGYTMICYAVTAPTVPVGTVTSPTTSITMSGLTPGIGVTLPGKA